MGNTLILGELNWVFVENEVAFVVKLLELYNRSITIGLQAVNAKYALFDQFFGILGPFKQVVFLKNRHHLRTCQVMSHGRFEKRLIRAFTISFLGRRNNFDTRKSNFEVETVFDHAVPLNGLVETDLQRS